MKTPFVTKTQLEEITKTYPTPFHIYDEKGIREKARALYQAFSWNKGFKEFFAVKATPTPAILKILHEENCGVDCASGVELLLSQKCGFSKNEIMFSSNDTPKEEFLAAQKLGATINLDAYDHIAFLSALTKNDGFEFPKTMSLRYNPGGVFSMGTQIMDHPEASKFGMTKDQVVEGIKALKKLGVETFGLHSFLSCNTASNYYYPELARPLFEFALEIRDLVGVEIDFINLSGGIGVNYRPEEKPNDIAVIGEGVHRVFDETLAANGMPNVKIYTELGRFMLAPHGLLATRVLHKKKTYRTYIGVDASAVNLMRPAFYDAYHHITVLGKEKSTSTETVDVTGSLCENNDKFAKQRTLPTIEPGDLLVIHDTGAHGFSMGYQYNAKLRSAELLLQENGEAKLIRRAETPEDYFATLYGFDFE